MGLRYSIHRGDLGVTAAAQNKRRPNSEVGLVLAGGGARGAYEAGALSKLLPELEKRGERPGIILGTSIGALNATHIAATAHLPAQDSVDELLDLWRKVQFSDIIGPLLSVRELRHVLRYFARRSSPSLLDNTALPALLDRLINFDQLHANTKENLASLAVVATSYATGDSVVFHEGPPGVTVAPDVGRGILYFPTEIDRSHVQSSASIPVAFPATQVTAPAAAAGWYADGGTRLNTPIKPALRLGAKRVVVIGLNSTAPPPSPETGMPDIFDGAGQVVQALLADPIAQDVQTLAGYNSEVPAGARAQSKAGRTVVPYVFVAPGDRLTVGRLASQVFCQHLSSLRAFLRARDLVALGRIIGAGESATRAEVFSFLFFAKEFHEALIDLGRRDADRWLDLPDNDGPWRLEPPPVPTPPPARRARNRRAKTAAPA